MNNVAVFAGRFDPFTLGHYEIVSRAAKLFDKIVVAVSIDTEKSMFLPQDRVRIVEASVNDIKNVSVVGFSGFLTEFMKSNDIRYMVRGLRDSDDFGYERNLINIYKSMESTVECFYLMSDSNLTHISASFVREVIKLNGSIDNYLRPDAARIVNELRKSDKTK